MLVLLIALFTAAGYLAAASGAAYHVAATMAEPMDDEFGRCVAAGVVGLLWPAAFPMYLAIHHGNQVHRDR